MRHRRRTSLTAALVAALALGPLAVTPATAAPVSPLVASAVEDPSHSVAAATPLITGELAAGRTVTAVPGEAPAVDAVPTFQWLADGTPVAGATGTKLALTADQADKVVEVAVTWTVTGQEPVTVTSTSGLRVATAPRPVVGGTAVVGSRLTATAGTWSAGTALAYQWLADGAAITGATGSTFVPTNSQSGKAISVRVTGTKAGYQTLSRTSAVTKRVMRWAVPTIAGTVAVGSTLTAKPGTWTTGTTRKYQWFANGAAISGATAYTFKLGTAQKDKRITVRVTGSKTGHPTVAKTSANTSRVQAPARPTIAGTAVAGNTLTAKTGTWSANTIFTYRWYANGVAISGATNRTYKIGAGQANKRIQVKVTGRKSGYPTVTKSSASSQRVQLAPRPTISGTPKVGQTLTAKRGTWTSGTTFTYRWYANGNAISGATSYKLKLSSSRKGQTITVKVTGRKSGYPTVTRTSAATARVAGTTTTAPTPPSGPVAPIGKNCPSSAPIKGNHSSSGEWIYHVPGGQYYSVTVPEQCFATEAAAVAAGYRKSKR